ncbi:hypothetical protein HCZ23_14280 [Celeribacter sp. HF31]|uniref:hypothetical protein n=1 Tax=Celeribacter sp. HF31 TaxID=2721558 RepID=UPI001430469B|nr:hypothetical protein [Celeribacter sp. HF31]NIY80629.1 hypothetical protein [Celeribacter sp. HF31]
MYTYDKETKTARNTETGSSITYLRTEGMRADAIDDYRYRSATQDFEFGIRVDPGDRQAAAKFPMPDWSKSTSQERNEIRRRQWDWQREQKIHHSEIREVSRKMPLKVDVAEDLMRLVWVRVQVVYPWKKSNVGFLNAVPPYKELPYLKLDEDQNFSVNMSGTW